jgi:hypothetical protein
MVEGGKEAITHGFAATLLGVTCTFLALSPVAGAVDTYVDATRPDDSDPTCSTPATACKTINGAVNKAGTDDTVYIVDPAAPTTYAESVSLIDGRSLVSLSASPTEVIVDNGSANIPAVHIAPPGTGGASTVSGLTIRGDYMALDVQRPALITGNVFDDGGPITNPLKTQVQALSSASGTTLEGNDFIDPTPTPGENQVGLSSFASGATEITGNGFLNFVVGMFVGGDDSSTPLVRGNIVRGTRAGDSAGVGLTVTAGDATITGNTLRNPVFAQSTDSVSGIVVEPVGGGELQATLKRNVVLDHRLGILVEDTTGPVTLEGDLVADSLNDALVVSDAGTDDPGVGDVTATNVTLVDTDDPANVFEAEAFVSDAELTLNSAIVGAAGISTNGAASCAISFSRGPTTAGTSCQQFQTTANPLFVDPAVDDYALQAGSPMIDAGDPTPPPLGATDLQGDLRLLDGNGDCASIRDIGADEFEPAAPPACPPPEAVITKGPKPKSERRRVRFKFTTDPLQPGAYFECKRDQKHYKPCTSPKKYGPLKAGGHVFRVRASEPTDGQGPADKLRFRILD